MLKSTDDVIRFLAQVTAAADRGDHPEAYGVFARTYHRMTLEMIVAIADGSFQDPPKMSAFVAAFADKYRRAIENTPKKPWRVAFDAAANPPRILRAMLTGINAHMAYDLVTTLVEDGFADPAHRRDYDEVNRVLARAIDPVQRIVEDRYADWLRIADVLGRRVDEYLSLESFEKTRTRAWKDAEQILAGNLSLDQVERRIARRGKALSILPL